MIREAQDYLQGQRLITYLLRKYVIVTIIRIMTIQIVRLVKNCFNLELDCRKAGSTNKSIPNI